MAQKFTMIGRTRWYNEGPEDEDRRGWGWEVCSGPCGIRLSPLEGVMIKGKRYCQSCSMELKIGRKVPLEPLTKDPSPGTIKLDIEEKKKGRNPMSKKSRGKQPVKPVEDELDEILQDDAVEELVDDEDEVEDEAPKRSRKTKSKVAKPKAADKTPKAKGKTPAAFGPRELPSGHKGAADLAEALHIPSTEVRRRLRSQEIPKGETGLYSWPPKEFDRIVKKLKS